jgi:branched-chain amino acid aminotransferase
MRWLNGDIIAAAEAKIPAEDRGLLFGEGAFETVRAYNGEPFRFTDHVARLRRSLAVVGIDAPGDLESRLRRAVADLLHANHLPNARVRITITAGVEGGHPNLIVAAYALTDWPSAWWTEGIRTIIAQQVRDPHSILSGLKSTNYLLSRLATLEATSRGAHEALVRNTFGRIAEGATSNCFIVVDGKLRTPPLSEGILDGITRQVVLELAARNGLSAEESPIDVDVLMAADEVFITSSVREMVPVTMVDDQVIGNGVPGRICLQLLRDYRREAGNPDPVPS